jgi:hypothetical protein
MKFKTRHVLPMVAWTLGSALLGGCGGGGASPAPPGTFDVRAAISAMFQNAATYQMSGTVPASQTGSVAVELHETDTFAPGAPLDPRIGDFPGTRLVREATPPAIPIGATAPTSRSETYYYSPGVFRLVARLRDSVLERFTVSADLPAAAMVGQSGLYATSTVDESTVANFVQWKVDAADAPDSAWVCLVFAGRQISTSQCVRVGAQGAITGARIVNEGPLLGATVDLRTP